MPLRAVAILSSLLLGACSVIGIRSGTEEPRYDVVGRIGDAVEIRRYAPRLAAETVVAAPEEAARNEGFRRLARYIFGGNRGQARIAMTAPVAQQAAPGGERMAMTAPVGQVPAGEGRWAIRFFMPASYTRDTLPLPEDPAVAIIEAPAVTVAVLRFAGVPDAAALAARRAELAQVLAGSAWAAQGAGEDWFYDPPWTLPPLRRNEVVVPVAPRT